jgi:deazaflavin-dependent oxidoreductase (nitroreductase family)
MTRGTRTAREDLTVPRRLFGTMSDANDFNTTIIEEFRAKDGKVGGPFEGAPVLLLHTKGAKTGLERVNPLVYQQVGDDIAIFASKGGAPSHPDWYRNVVANPDVTVEIGPDTIPMRAHVASADERAPIWEKQKQDMPGFAAYEAATDREIPVVVLRR